jgi:hypothetical protein
MPTWTGGDAHGKGAFITKIATVGLDLAKNVLQLHGADSQGRLVVRKQLRRTEVLRHFAKLEPCLVGMEACGSSHYWGRELAKLGCPSRFNDLMNRVPQMNHPLTTA